MPVDQLFFSGEKKTAEKFTLDGMREYENIVNYLTFGTDKSEWVGIITVERCLVMGIWFVTKKLTEKLFKLSKVKTGLRRYGERYE